MLVSLAQRRLAPSAERAQARCAHPWPRAVQLLCCASLPHITWRRWLGAHRHGARTGRMMSSAAPVLALCRVDVNLLFIREAMLVLR